MANGEKKSAQIIAINAHKGRASSHAHETSKPARYGYCIGGYGFLVDESVPGEVVIAPEIFPVPKAPEWLLGLTNVRGNIVPVFDLWKFVRTHKPERETCTVLVLEQGETAVGLVIDGLPKPVPADSQAVRASLSMPALQPYLGRVVQAFDCEWWEFDYQQFLTRLSAADAR